MPKKLVLFLLFSIASLFTACSEGTGLDRKMDYSNEAAQEKTKALLAQELTSEQQEQFQAAFMLVIVPQIMPQMMDVGMSAAAGKNPDEEYKKSEVPKTLDTLLTGKTPRQIIEAAEKK